MRKLISKEEREKKRRRNSVVVGVILVFLMVASTLGYAIQSTLGDNSNNNANSNELEYNGFKLSYVNGFWVIGNFVFRNSPKDVQDVGSGFNDALSYQGLPVYIQSENEDAEIEATLNLRQISERVQRACISSTNCTDGLPIKTCNDNFIIIKESEIERVSQEGNCVYIEGKKENLVALTDGFLFKILGIK